MYDYIINNKNINDYVESKDQLNKIDDIEEVLKDMNISSLYITGYMASISSDDYDFKRYISRLKKTTYDTSSYRLIGIFDYDEGKITRYASIKIDNTNSVSNVGDNNE